MLKIIIKNTKTNHGPIVNNVIFGIRVLGNSMFLLWKILSIAKYAIIIPISIGTKIMPLGLINAVNVKNDDAIKICLSDLVLKNFSKNYNPSKKKFEKSIEVSNPLPTQKTISFVAKKIRTSNPTYLPKNFVDILSEIIKNKTAKIGFI